MLTLRPTDSPARVALFNNIASFVHEQLSLDASEPALKRRRVGGDNSHSHANGAVAGGAPGGPSGSVAGPAAEPVLLEVKDISLGIPMRKKLDLCFTKNYLYARAPGTSVPIQGTAHMWKDIGTNLRVPPLAFGRSS